jgi:ankyrin repeat protein
MGNFVRNSFLEILSDNEEIQLLSAKKRLDRINKILADLDKDALLDSDIFVEDDSEIEDEEILNSFLKKEKNNFEKVVNIDKIYATKNTNTLSIASLERIKQKRIELSKDTRLKIKLTDDDFGNVNLIRENQIASNTYGRSPLHEAIALRDIDSIEKYAMENKFLNDVDNNGNTPYNMAYQEGYFEAMEILEKYVKVA